MTTDITQSTSLNINSTRQLQNQQTSLRCADRTVLNDFSRNYTLIPQNLIDPSRCRIEETELTRKIISGRCNPRKHLIGGEKMILEEYVCFKKYVLYSLQKDYIDIMSPFVK